MGIAAVNNNTDPQCEFCRSFGATALFTDFRTWYCSRMPSDTRMKRLVSHFLDNQSYKEWNISAPPFTNYKYQPGHKNYSRPFPLLAPEKLRAYQQTRTQQPPKLSQNARRRPALKDSVICQLT